MALGIGVVAAGLIVAVGQYLIGLAFGVPAIAGLGDVVLGAAFNLLIFGALLAVALLFLMRGAGIAGIAGPGATAMLGAGLPLGMAGVGMALGLGTIAITVGSGGTPASAAVLAGLVMVLFQAGVEEVYFRGWLQPLAVRAWGAVAGVGIVAVAFALLHVAGGARAPLALLNIFLAGVFFGVLALRTGGIALSAGAHFGWNATETIVFGLDPNPGVGSFGAMFDLDMTGAAIWGGSEQGLNGSIGVTIVLLALILPIGAWRGRVADA